MRGKRQEDLCLSLCLLSLAFDPENERSTFLRIVRIALPGYTASHLSNYTLLFIWTLSFVGGGHAVA
jgi:hypothetical protein